MSDGNKDAHQDVQVSERDRQADAASDKQAEKPGSGQGAPPPGKEPGASSEPSKRQPIWPWLLAALLILGFAGAVIYVIYAPSAAVYTDDAFVTAHYASVAPRISGQIASVNVDDNEPVKTGTLLATIDDRDYRAVLANDEAMLERDRAQLADAVASIERQPSVVDQSQTQNPSATAQLMLALANQRRYRGLAASGAGTTQERQQADEQVQRAQAAVDQARAATESARRQQPILEARRAAAQATIKADEARVEQARLNLSYTRITAPVDGMVAQRTVQTGNYVAPGTALMVVAPLDQIYIEANYREVALRHVLPGQHVRIHVDAYDLDLDGVVDSVSPASGAAFGAIQPNNATGNFTKIAQRLPVKILVSPGQNEARLLRLGFSVETTINTELADVRERQRDSTTPVTERHR
jgi:membrane fusion protein (multidrug efflux system)